MDSNRDAILSIIYDTIDETNLFIDKNASLDKSLDTLIVHEDSQLDSLGVVNFITMLEDSINKKFDKKISLIEEMSIDNNIEYFSNVNGLLDFFINKL